MKQVRIREQWNEMKTNNPKLAIVSEIVLTVMVVVAVIWLVENLPACVRFIIQKFSK